MNSPFRPAAWLTLSLLAAGAARATEPQLVRDIDQRLQPEDNHGHNSFVATVGRVNGKILVEFVGTSAAVHSGLWASDGTASGSIAIGSSLPASNDQGLLEVAQTENLLFYYTSEQTADGVRRRDLWRSDGTPAGTYRLANAGSLPFGQPSSLFAFGSRAFYTQCGALGCEPGISDGTIAGTHLLRDLSPGRIGSAPHEPVLLRGELYFLANAPEGAVLWRSDGSARGTARVYTFPAGVSPGDLLATPERLYFRIGTYSGATPGTRAALWTSDGTAAGTHAIPPFVSNGPRGLSYGSSLGAVAGNLYFTAVSPATGTELWRTDGSSAGTRSLLALGRSAPNLSPPVRLGDRAAFVGPGDGLWTTRGTKRSTIPLTPCKPRCAVRFSTLYSAQGPVRLGDKLLLLGNDAAAGIEPWVTDGTADGTLRLADTCRGSCDGYSQFLGATAGRVYFTTSQGDLWATDGTQAGTAKLWHFGTDPGAALQPLGALNLAGLRRESATASEAKDTEIFLFSMFDPARGSEIWRSDGTLAGTEPYFHLSNGAGADPTWLTALGSGIVFSACNGTLNALWRSHGSLADTVPIFSSPDCYLNDPGLVTLEGRAYFVKSGPSGFREQVWSTDGAASGAQQVTHFDDDRSNSLFAPGFKRGMLLLRSDAYGFRPQFWRIDPGPTPPTLIFEPAAPRAWAAAATATAERFFYTLQDDELLSSLWTSDGTATGSIKLMDLERNWDAAFPLEPVQIGDTTYLRLADFGYSEIWSSDGTAAGTRKFLPHPDAPTSLENPLLLTGLRGSLLLLDQRYAPGATKVALIRSDGTVPGSTEIKVFALGCDRDIFSPPPHTILDDTFYFLAATAEEGEELWRSDGTAAGTSLVFDIAPGPEDAKIENLGIAGGRITFSADDGVHGAELWSSDGTAGGTRRETDIAPGPLSSTPSGMAAAGGWLYFSADDGVHGRELWKLPLP